MRTTLAIFKNGATKRKIKMLLINEHLGGYTVTATKGASEHGEYIALTIKKDGVDMVFTMSVDQANDIANSFIEALDNE